MPLQTSNFHSTNSFFASSVYPKVLGFAFLPVSLLEVVVDKDKKIANYTASDVAKASILGALLVVPLTGITINIAVDLLIFAAVAHLLSAAIALTMDISKHFSSRPANARGNDHREFFDSCTETEERFSHR